MCETCLYNKNCQFIAKHPKAIITGCTAYKDSRDVVEVVRCINCVYWDGRGYDGRCEAPENGLIRDYTNYDDFCSYGERKEQE